MTLQHSPDAMVELVFPLEGQTLARDHAHALAQALCAQFPWLNNEHYAAAVSYTHLDVYKRQGHALVGAGGQRAGHDVDAVHACLLYTSRCV